MEASRIVDLERERSVGEILRATLGIYRRHPLLFAVLALVVIAPYELARLAATGVGPLGSSSGREASLFGLFSLFELLNFSLVGPLISALHVHAVIEIGEGRSPKLASVALRGLRVLPVVAAAEIVANILITLGLLAFVVPGVILMLRWVVVAQTAAVDHQGWVPALRRSRRLTAGHYRHIVGLLVVIGAVSAPILLGARAVTGGSAASVGWVSLGIVLDTLIGSFGALITAILYFDLRAREAEPGRRSVPEYQHVRDLD